VPGQNVYAKVVTICRVLPLAVPEAGPEELLLDELDELEEELEEEPSSGYSMILERKYIQGAPAPDPWEVGEGPEDEDEVEDADEELRDEDNDGVLEDELEEEPVQQAMY
jgi:hypothetical protein